jgi:hypothetical protein
MKENKNKVNQQGTFQKDTSETTGVKILNYKLKKNFIN